MKIKRQTMKQRILWLPATIIIICCTCALTCCSGGKDNPVDAERHTDATPAILHDTITITVSPEHHVLVATGYSASEYPPFRGFLNVGDIHSCEPWLYSECLEKNISVRARAWREKNGQLR